LQAVAVTRTLSWQAVRFLLVSSALFLASCGGGREPTPAAAEKAAPATSALAPKITQFYATKPAVPKGEATLLCYGVESAVSVALEPPAAKVSPALSRCFEVKPAQTTTYTLVVEGRDGSKARQEVTVSVGGARPRLFDLSINKEQVRPGEEVQFCFQSSNATSVTGSPGKFLRGGKPEKDCLVHSPTQTTTYSVTVTNAQQLTDSATIKVEVKP
jgi:hypothetical protein